jgi:hypothetical protein
MKRRAAGAITRRDLAAVAMFPLLARPASAQAPASAADELAAARQQTQRTAEQLRQFKIPIATEPSFAFHP